MLNLELLAIREIGVNGMSVCLKPKVPVVLTPGLVEEMRQLQNSLAENYLSNTLEGSFYVVWFLEDRKGLCCHGLDFNFLCNCMKNNKTLELERYINCIFDLIFLNYIGLGFPIINCSVVSRPLTGLSKEFFLLNKICFIHNKQCTGIEKISINRKFNHFNKLLFQKDIYEKNHYFYFPSLQLDAMRMEVESIHYEVPSVEEINSVKEQFELIKQDTLASIYSIASRNLKILERMARYDLKLCA